ncbi:MAG: dTDP-4-dehydrorhamnose reductase, partial [Chloroflexi bacterium]|nr:dTDP-4-dehydrorhamnose reductase [Chloroflexota bacterium]
HDVQALSHSELDVTDAKAAVTAVDAFAPDVVIHTAALTDTTRCEREPELALAVNAQGTRNVAEACAPGDAAMVYVSTNEVFDGAQAEPYLESDPPRPLNQYGASKLAGERHVIALLPRHYIVRVGWLYGPGGDHFVAKVLRAAARGAIDMVGDETATPTWTHDLAGAIARLIETGVHGVYHLTNAGMATRYEWAEEILRLAGRSDAILRRTTTAAYRASLPSDALVPHKPPFSVLRNVAAAQLGIELPPWRDALARFWTPDGR